MFVVLVMSMTGKNTGNPDPQGAVAMGLDATFAQLFRSYHKALCYYVNRLVTDPATAEDIVSEVFMQCWVHQRVFENEDHARFFLYRAARNAAINHQKVTQRAEAKHERAILGEVDSEESHQERYIRSEVLREIYAQIETLPRQERIVLLLTVRDGKKLSEIADELQLSLQTVKNCKTRAIQRLRGKLSVKDFLVLLAFFAADHIL